MGKGKKKGGNKGQNAADDEDWEALLEAESQAMKEEAPKEAEKQEESKQEEAAQDAAAAFLAAQGLDPNANEEGGGKKKKKKKKKGGGGGGGEQKSEEKVRIWVYEWNAMSILLLLYGLT